MNCTICRRPFEKHGWRKRTCGDPICVKTHELRRQRLYARRYYGYGNVPVYRTKRTKSRALEALKLRLRVLSEYEANAQNRT